jgi:Sec-independent protein secretion pathway component TatC
MVAAAKVGWVKQNYFSIKRKYAYMVMLLFSFLLSAGDLIGAILLCLPLFALYESGIIIIRLFTNKTDSRDIESESSDL